MLEKKEKKEKREEKPQSHRWTLGKNVITLVTVSNLVLHD